MSKKDNYFQQELGLDEKTSKAIRLLMDEGLLEPLLIDLRNALEAEEFQNSTKSSGIKLIKTIKERCNISFLQLRFKEDKELNGSPHKPFVDYLTNKIGFSKVKPLSIQDDYKGKPSIIYKCTR